MGVLPKASAEKLKQSRVRFKDLLNDYLAHRFKKPVSFVTQLPCKRVTLIEKPANLISHLALRFPIQ